jgi:hypothetical protein
LAINYYHNKQSTNRNYFPGDILLQLDVGFVNIPVGGIDSPLPFTAWGGQSPFLGGLTHKYNVLNVPNVPQSRLLALLAGCMSELL